MQAQHLLIPGQRRINKMEYPGFKNDLKKAGFRVEVGLNEFSYGLKTNHFFMILVLI